VITGFKHNCRCPQGGLCGKECRYISRESNLDASLGQRLENDVDIRGTAGGQSGHGVHVLFIYNNRSAYNIEQRAGGVDMGLFRISSFANSGHALTENAGSIGHCSHHRHFGVEPPAYAHARTRVA